MRIMKRLAALILALALTLSAGAALADRDNINSFLNNALNRLNSMDLGSQSLYISPVENGQDIEVRLQKQGGVFSVVGVENGAVMVNIQVSDKAVVIESQGQAYGLRFEDIPGLIDSLTGMLAAYTGASGASLDLNFNYDAISASLVDLFQRIIGRAISATYNGTEYALIVSLTDRQISQLTYEWIDDMITNHGDWLQAYVDAANGVSGMMNTLGSMGMMGSGASDLGDIAGLLEQFGSVDAIRAYWQENKDEAYQNLLQSSTDRSLFLLKIRMDQQGNLTALRFESNGRAQLDWYYEGDTLVMYMDTGYGYQPYYVTADSDTELRVTNGEGRDVGSLRVEEEGGEWRLYVSIANSRYVMETIVVGIGAQKAVPAINNPTYITSVFQLMTMMN